MFRSHSALTDFLASHNISAAQIAADANARRAAAATDGDENDDNEGNADNNENDAVAAPSDAGLPEATPPARSTAARANSRASKKRKLEQMKAKEKAKAAKKARDSRRDPDDSSSFVSSSEDELSSLYRRKAGPLPKQMENCATCLTRFAVTAYTRSGANGGLICAKCARDLDTGKRSKKSGGGAQRRQQQSKVLDGEANVGSKSLMNLCIGTLVKNVALAESFGDLPPNLVDKLAASLSKRRLVDPVTLDLFLQPGQEVVTVYDAAKLKPDDFIRIFQVVPTVRSLRLRNSVQFKDHVMKFLIDSTVLLSDFSIHGANLISDDMWNEYLLQKGRHLSSLKVYYTDGHFGDEQVDLLKNACPNLIRLKIAHNQKMTDAGVKHIAGLSSLQHLTLELYKKTTTEPYLEVLSFIGHQLRTLALATIETVSNEVLEKIHENCKRLVKLRLTDNEEFTDAAFVKLFTDWSNPPLHYIDFHKCRQLDAAQPIENPDNIGLCSAGFEALMAHSGSALKHLNIHSCRHISREALEKVFAGKHVYPELKTMDLSFIWAVDDFVVGSIFRSCPNLHILKVFGNFQVTQDVEPLIPFGKILIGVPFAMGLEMKGQHQL